ncbi:TPA: hypothetical protein R1956_002556 [Staphylococcus delphini]|nr:hypothetical protein [Staphylococcus delphini]
MKSKFFKLSIGLLALIISLSFVFPSINAKADVHKQTSAEGVPNKLGKKMEQNFGKVNEEEAAEEIEYIINNVYVYDEEGYLIDVDEQKSIDRYGYVPKEFKEMKSALNYQKKLQKENKDVAFRSADYRTSNQCFSGEMKKSFSDLIPTGTIAALMEDGQAGKLSQGTVVKTLKQLGKTAVKGNIYGLAAQIIWIDQKCAWSYPALDPSLT